MFCVAAVMQRPQWTASNITDVSPASGAQKSETALCTGSAFSASPSLWSSKCPELETESLYVFLSSDCLLLNTVWIISILGP